MELIRKTKTTITKNGNRIYWGIFLCPFDNKEVELSINNGKKQKSCGCVGFKGINNGMYGKKHTERTKLKQTSSAKGKKRKLFTEAHIKNMSEAQKGHFVSEETKQKIREGNKDKIISEETRKIWSEQRKGENNWNWNNGSSFEPFGIEFNKELKQFILERDNSICQCPDCEHKSTKLDVHHIDFNKKNNNSDNLIILCTSCHMKTNFKKQYFTEFYQSIIKEKYL